MWNGSSRRRRRAVKVINGSCVRKADADMELPAAASANYDAPFTVERFELLALVAEASGRTAARHLNVRNRCPESRHDPGPKRLFGGSVSFIRTGTRPGFEPGLRKLLEDFLPHNKAATSNIWRPGFPRPTCGTTRPYGDRAWN
jgi:hypothetical protein